jgi:hypothetical protein
MHKDFSRRKALQLGALAAALPAIPGTAHADPVAPQGLPVPRSWVVRPFELD